MFILLTEDAELNSGGAMNLVENFLPLVIMIIVVVASCWTAKFLVNKWINELKNKQEEKFNKIVKKFSEIVKDGDLLQECNCYINVECKSYKKGTVFSSVDYRKEIDNINNFYSSLDLEKIESSDKEASNEILDCLYERVRYLRYSINSFNVTTTVFEAVLISCLFWIISLFDLNISNLEVGVCIFVAVFVAFFIFVFCLHSWIEKDNNNNPYQLMKEYELSLLNKKIEEFYKSFDSYKKIKQEKPNGVVPDSGSNNSSQTVSLTSDQPRGAQSPETGGEVDTACGQQSETRSSETDGELNAVYGQQSEMKSSVNDDKSKEQATKSISTNDSELDVANTNVEDSVKS